MTQQTQTVCDECGETITGHQSRLCRTGVDSNGRPCADRYDFCEDCIESMLNTMNIQPKEVVE